MLLLPVDHLANDPLYAALQQALAPLLLPGGPEGSIHAGIESLTVFVPEERQLLWNFWEPLGPEEGSGFHRYRLVYEDPTMPDAQLAGQIAQRVTALVLG